MLDLGDLRAPPGSKPWALAVLHAALIALHDSESKVRSLRRKIEMMREHKGYRALGFKSLEEWQLASEPDGLGLTPDDLDRLALAHDDDRIAELGGPGRPPKGVDNSYNVRITGPAGNGRDYLLARMKRDHPDILAALKAGDYPSVRQAAIAAGIVRVPSPLEKAQKAYAKLNEKDRAAFLEWLNA